MVPGGSFNPSTVVLPLGLTSQVLVPRGQRITSYLPEDLPNQLQEVLQTSGLGDRMIQGARLLVNRHVVPQWSMEFSIDLSVEECQANVTLTSLDT